MALLTREQVLAKNETTVAVAESMMLQNAQVALDLGLAIFPLQPRSKKPFTGSHGFLDAKTGPDALAPWRDMPDANIGVAVGLSDLTVLDFDQGDQFIPAWVNETHTLKIRTAKGMHVYFRGSRSTTKMVVDGKTIGDIKSNGGYTLFAGSIHPDGPTYEIVDDSSIAPLSDRVDELVKDSRKPVDVNPNSTERVARGEHDNYLHRAAGKLRHMGLEQEGIKAILLEIADKRLDDKGPDWVEMVEKHARNIAKKPIGADERILFSGQEGTDKPAEQVKAEMKVAADAAKTKSANVKFPEYAMTEEEIDAELEKEFPRILLAPSPGPTWDDEILYGPAGQLTKMMAEYNEGHPAGIYLNLLVSIGNAMGRRAHFRINSSTHYTNEFLANVGLSSYGRKGSARDAVNEFMKMLDPEWAKERILSGFGSGEAIVYAIRDTFEQTVPIKDKGKPIRFEKVVVPGIEDKRLTIRESELASVFVMAGKQDSLAGAILRNGWDGNALSNNVKGQNKQGLSMSARCESPHISISGDISAEELKASLPEGSENNGFGNRFLYCYVSRTKKCPNGGPEITGTPEYAKLLLHFHSVLEHVQTVSSVPFSKAAEKVWGRMYLTLDESARHEGLTAKMTSRGAAHVRRLAVILALIDLSSVVETEHLHAALGIWKYCEDSARYIFSGVTQDESKLLDWVKTHGPVTVGQVRSDFYHRNRKTEWVRVQLLDLVRQGKVVLVKSTDKANREQEVFS